MIVWRDKLLAFGIHFIATAVLAAVAAALIFIVWFPAPFGEMIGGAQLFVLVVGCDLALGPLMSLIVFNRAKSRSKLVIDYTIIGIVQLGALCYGVWVMAASRPVYIAFSKDRYEVVMAQAISDEDLAEARDPRYARLPLFGPQFVATHVPDSEQQDELFQELAGHETQNRPRYYVPYSSALPEIRQRGGVLAALEKRHPEAKVQLEAAAKESGVPVERLRWLPVAARLGFWTVLVDFETGKPVAYVPLDPY